MRNIRWIAPASLVVALMTGGCTDFLTTDDATRDPNQPSQASRDQLFVGVQAGQFGVQESSLAMQACLMMQQCAGTNNRFVQARHRYSFTETDFSPDFTQLYAGGGLVDIRTVKASAQAAGDSIYTGIARVWEAFIGGTAADVFGDVPFREASNPDANPFPHLDPQEQVYADVQTLLDEAIGALESGVGAGPGLADLVYNGNAAKWIEAAYTLKARYHMHTEEVRGTAAYTDAIAAALNGISDPANDFRALHNTATSERNIWFQFQQTTFGADLIAGKLLVDLMVSRSDPRLPEYFGNAPGGGYGGQDPDGGQSPNGASPLAGERNVPDFRQPFVTYQENQLILAEAYAKTSQDGPALTALNNARQAAGLGTLSGLTGDALMAEIIIEKYIALFQNIEVWNDYKRTCFRAGAITAIDLVPFDGSVAVTPGEVPGRLFYGQTEHNANPNIPSIADQLSRGGVAEGRPSVNGFRNPNDPAACT